MYVLFKGAPFVFSCDAHTNSNVRLRRLCTVTPLAEKQTKLGDLITVSRQQANDLLRSYQLFSSPLNTLFLDPSLNS
jgi:hypothetical protein